MSKKREIEIYDTTLRDGAQTVGISFSVQDKLRIAAALDRSKIDYIEGGWPGSNPKDDLFFKEIRNEDLQYSKIVAFGATKRHKISVNDDTLLQALVSSEADAIAIVAKTWDFQVKSALEIELKENLAIIRETIVYLKDLGKQVFLDAEHFFDGFKSTPDYSLECLQAAAGAGADALVLCDTNGGTMPDEVERIVKSVVTETDRHIGVHFHNDTGVAVANSQAAVLAGASSVQGTINGYGERCGNCDLTTLIPNLHFKMGYRCNSADRMEGLTELSRFVSETANLAHNERMPYVGDNTFAHKGGIHVSAIQKDNRTYEHIDPSLVGNRRKIAVSELSGKSNILLKSKEMGINLEGDVKLPREILQKLKSLEDSGFQFEAAEGSFELIIRESTGEYVPFFKLKGFRVITEMLESGEMICEGTIKVEVNGVIEHTAANGNGPVSALDNALRKSLEKFYPNIKDIQLTDYKVRVLNEKDGTSALVRVIIDQKSGTDHWGTVGVSTNIIDASWQAIVDGIEYKLFKDLENKKA
jgi:2-isopropylmalate synthase